MIKILKNMQVWWSGWRRCEVMEGYGGGAAEGRGGGRVRWLVDLVVLVRC